MDVTLPALRTDAAAATVEFGGVRIEARSGSRPTGSAISVKPGDAALVVSSSMLPSAASRATGWHDCSAFLVGSQAVRMEIPPAKYLLSIVFPAAILQEVGSHLGDALAVDVGSALFWPFLAFAWTTVVEGAQQTGLTMYYTERLLEEMITGIIVASLRTADANDDVQSYAAALSMIAARVGDSALRPALLARDLNVSLRTLQRQFAAHGTTIERSVRKSRVNHAVALLRDRTYDSLSIDRVAQACGLSNGSSLARAFAAEGLERPGTVRAAARA